MIKHDTNEDIYYNCMLQKYNDVCGDISEGVKKVKRDD